MRHLSYFSLLFIAIMAISCASQKDTEEALIQEEARNFESAFNNKADNNVYHVTCDGSCDCYLRGDYQHVACSCNDCVMIISITKDGKTENFSLSKTQFEIETIADFYEYTSTKYEGKTIKIRKIEVVRVGTDASYLYHYTTDQGAKNSAEETVLIAMARGKVYVIECDGDCGCTERFNFDPPSASCGCEDCILTVTEKQ